MKQYFREKYEMLWAKAVRPFLTGLTAGGQRASVEANTEELAVKKKKKKRRAKTKHFGTWRTERGSYTQMSRTFLFFHIKKMSSDMSGGKEGKLCDALQRDWQSCFLLFWGGGRFTTQHTWRLPSWWVVPSIGLTVLWLSQNTGSHLVFLGRKLLLLWAPTSRM